MDNKLILFFSYNALVGSNFEFLNSSWERGHVNLILSLLCSVQLHTPVERPIAHTLYSLYDVSFMGRDVRNEV